MTTEIFIPFEVRRGRADASQIRLAIAVEVRDSASRRCDSTVVYDLLVPFPCSVLPKDIDATTCSAIAGDDLTFSISVQIGGQQHVAVHQTGIDHFALSGRID